MFRLLDTVTLRTDRPDLGITAGQVGAVVLVHDDLNYEVEFVGEDGQALALVNVQEANLVVWEPQPQSALTQRR
jgi:Domain of unknown function (DUF4926)